MNIAQRITKDTDRDEISVTYDLAIAKLAMQIQAAESPRYDNVFVLMGAFHTEMAFFKALGKFIAESGGPSILVASETIASGSLKGFITGKLYNRCKRIHPLLAVAMEILHFKLFLSVSQIESEYASELLQMQDKNFSTESLSKELIEMIHMYLGFKENTRNGIHGKTAQYWIIYVDLVDLYHQFSRSTRTGNFELYVYTLQMVTNLFFCFNQPNYSRWTVRLQDNLLKIDETHPSLAGEFRNGRFGLKRTAKEFSRMPKDLALEQTINADAANQRTGISAFTNSISARQRWAHSHYLRISVVSHLLEKLDLNHKEDVSADLQGSKKRKNAETLKSISSHIERTLNPFSNEIDRQHLFNIASGKSASDQTTNFLLNVPNIGHSAREKFVKECEENSAIFEEPIRRQKLATFASEGVPLKKKDGKVTEVKMERNLFGRLLCIALGKKIDIGEVLRYPLTPVPLSMCHLDGTMASTKKDVLATRLEKMVTSLPSPYIDCHVIDGMFFLRTTGEFPITSMEKLRNLS